MEAFSRLPIPARGEKNQTKSLLYVTLLHFEKASNFNTFRTSKLPVFDAVDIFIVFSKNGRLNQKSEGK